MFPIISLKWHYNHSFMLNHKGFTNIYASLIVFFLLKQLQEYIKIDRTILTCINQRDIDETTKIKENFSF